MKTQHTPVSNEDEYPTSAQDISILRHSEAKLTEKYGQLTKAVIVLSLTCLILAFYLLYNSARPTFPLCSSEEQTAPDQALLLNLREYYREKGARSIVDFGVKQCALLSLLEQNFEVVGVNPTTIDRAPFMRRIDVGRQVSLHRKFDYAQTFHVGLYYHAEFEDIFFGNLAAHATKGIVMSWDRPGEGGLADKSSHGVENITRKIETYGFKYNKEVSEKMRAQFNIFFKDSIMVFEKVDESQKSAEPEYIEFLQTEHVPPNPVLMDILKKYYKEKNATSIVDFGCGNCQVIKLLKDQGYDVLGVDSTPYSKASFVQKRDLSKMIRLPKTYDFVQSFEVGEHIYTELEDVFISNLVWNAERGLILSWAVEGQSGFRHINTHNNDYIIAKIEGYGFKYNKELSSEFKAQFDNWFKNSLMVFDRV